MKKIRYNSWIANHLLFKGYRTITIAAWVCTRYRNKSEMPQRVRNHECTHARQWCECMLASGVIIWILVLLKRGHYMDTGAACRHIRMVVRPFVRDVLHPLCAGMAREAVLLRYGSLPEHQLRKGSQRRGG